jgi:hypothetical protein
MARPSSPGLSAGRGGARRTRSGGRARVKRTLGEQPVFHMRRTASSGDTRRHGQPRGSDMKRCPRNSSGRRAEPSPTRAAGDSGFSASQARGGRSRRCAAAGALSAGCGCRLLGVLQHAWGTIMGVSRAAHHLAYSAPRFPVPGVIQANFWRPAASSTRAQAGEDSPTGRDWGSSPCKLLRSPPCRDQLHARLGTGWPP